MTLALRHRIAAAVTALQAVLIIGVLWLLHALAQGAIDRQMEAKAQALVQTVGEVSRAALLRGEYDDLQPYVERLTADPDVVRVRLADRRGVIVVSTLPAEVGERLLPPDPTAPGRYRTISEIRNVAGPLGSLAIELSDATLRGAYERTRDLALALAVLGILAGGAFGILTGRLLTRRLEALADATQQLAKGNFDVSLPTHGSDEVAALSRLFNHMTQSLRSHIESLRRSEEQLRTAQRMEAMGRLAGGVAHDFNNLLTVIQGHCDIALLEVEAMPDVREDLLAIRQAGESAAALTRQLLAFSRRQVLQPRVLNLNELVTGTEKMLRRVIGEDVRLVSRLQEQVWLVRADPGQAEQVVLNLVVNSRDAMPRGGTLTIETSNVVLDESYAQRHPGVHPGEYVLVAVSDTGEGMNAETLARCFEPFFTTKKEGRGTGLGLSTVLGIVQQSGGHVGAYSEPGRGSTFKVYFPRAADVVREEGPRVEPVPALPTGGTILVAEDSEGVRRLVRQILERRGFSVLEARSAEEALEAARRHPGPILLLLTDVVMPGINGREMAERLRAERPGLRVLYMSGYTEDAILAQGLLRGSIDFIEKPFTTFALERKVAEVLGRREPGGVDPRA